MVCQNLKNPNKKTTSPSISANMLSRTLPYARKHDASLDNGSSVFSYLGPSVYVVVPYVQGHREPPREQLCAHFPSLTSCHLHPFLHRSNHWNYVPKTKEQVLNMPCASRSLYFPCPFTSELLLRQTKSCKLAERNDSRNCTSKDEVFCPLQCSLDPRRETPSNSEDPCMHVCVYVYVYVCMYMYMYTYMYMYEHACMYVYVYACICMSICVCTCI